MGGRESQFFPEQISIFPDFKLNHELAFCLKVQTALQILSIMATTE